MTEIRLAFMALELAFSVWMPLNPGSPLIMIRGILSISRSPRAWAGELAFGMLLSTWLNASMLLSNLDAVHLSKGST